MHQISSDADTGNIRGVYEGIRKAILISWSQTKQNSSTKLGKIIKDKQMNRWVEHHSDPKARENQVFQAALDAIESLPVLYDLDTTLTKEELSVAIGRLPPGLKVSRQGCYLYRSHQVWQYNTTGW